MIKTKLSRQKSGEKQKDLRDESEAIVTIPPVVRVVVVGVQPTTVVVAIRTEEVRITVRIV